MTNLERKILDFSKILTNEEIKDNTLHEVLNEIVETEEFKNLAPEDKSALMAVVSIRTCLEQNNARDKEPQALWRFIRYLTEVEMPLQIIDYTYFLFPTNEKYFARILTPTAFNIIQRQAALMLKNNNYEDEEHKAHLQKIVDGQMPYGYSLEMPTAKEAKDEE